MVVETDKISRWRVYAAGLLAGACGLTGNIPSALKSALLGICIATAFVFVERYISKRKFDNILVCPLVGAVFCLPCSLVSWLLPESFHYSGFVLPDHINILAPLVYGFLFILGTTIKRKFNLGNLSGFNIIYLLMLIGGILRLYPLILDTGTFIYACVGALATVTSFSIVMYVSLFTERSYRYIFFSKKLTGIVLRLEAVVLLFLSCGVANNYGRSIGVWMFEAGKNHPGITREINTPFYVDDNIYINNKIVPISNEVADQLSKIFDGYIAPEPVNSGYKKSLSPDKRYILYANVIRKGINPILFVVVKDLETGKEHILKSRDLYAEGSIQFDWLTPEVAQRAINNKLTEEKP